MWRYLSRYFADRQGGAKFAGIAQSRCPRPGEPEITELLDAAAKALHEGWDGILLRLKEAGELSRLLEVEAPVQSIFANRQSVGIAVDHDVVDRLLKEVADEKYEAYHSVAAALNSSPSGLNFWNVSQHLERTDASHLLPTTEGGLLREAFKMAAPNSGFARDFLQFADASRDETILRRASGVGNRLHPIFNVMGTVSGRILVADPFLQQLRRGYRSLIAPDPNKRLAYLDYAQFEPGIMASLAHDSGFVAAYNRGDVYEALSERVFGTVEDRPLAKRIFLAFSYGMTLERIATLAVAPNATEAERGACKEAVQGFFDAYPGLAKFRADMEAQLSAKGYVSSAFGNRRKRANAGPLNRKERRWAVNQPIQATASLVFKEALIDLARQFGAQSILLPMHDAVLMQFDLAGYDDAVTAAQTAMVEAFQRRCPTVIPRVVVGPFSIHQ
ncbi:DNA polymerase [Phenylobacterium sp.]|uniref:DNA polymerase n=1 Tax=Phenylobacterium sp. TaxID=1871053 RepID=UPI002601477E|nr:DNA polymerase [Phenylobacterium sp.]